MKWLRRIFRRSPPSRDQWVTDAMNAELAGMETELQALVQGCREEGSLLAARRIRGGQAIEMDIREPGEVMRTYILPHEPTERGDYDWLLAELPDRIAA